MHVLVALHLIHSQLVTLYHDHIQWRIANIGLRGLEPPFVFSHNGLWGRVVARLIMAVMRLIILILLYSVSFVVHIEI